MNALSSTFKVGPGSRWRRRDMNDTPLIRAAAKRGLGFIPAIHAGRRTIDQGGQRVDQSRTCRSPSGRGLPAADMYMKAPHFRKEGCDGDAKRRRRR